MLIAGTPEFMLFCLILMRMSGFVLFNPVLPVTHPLAVTPAIGSKQGNFLTLELVFDSREKRFKNRFFQHFSAHRRTSQRDFIKVCDGRIHAGVNAVCFCACRPDSLCHSFRHRLSVSGC